MLFHHLRTAVRALRRRRGYTLLNVGGLAVGLACCVLIVLYVRSELAYDAHHERAARIVRVTHDDGASDHWAPVGPALGPALAAALPEVQAAVRLHPVGDDVVLRIGDARHLAPEGLYADSSVFDVFTIPLLAGDPATALARPSAVVLTAGLARRLFGTTDVVGRTVQRPGWDDLTVTAVAADPPATTHLPFTFLVSLSTFRSRVPALDEIRDWSAFYTYLLLRAPGDAARVEARLPGFADAFYAGLYDGPPSEAMALRLQPLRTIHLHSDLEKEYRAGGDALYVSLFGAVALLVLVIGVLNFINLTTARSAVRLREVGVRKVLGSSRGALVGHFLTESLVLAAGAGVLAYVLAAAGLPLLRTLAGSAVTKADLHAPAVLLGLAGLALGAGLGGGLLPAVHLAGFAPVRALRGGTRGHHGRALRRGLIVVQFAASIVLLSATAVVALQLHYVRSQSPGFDEARVVRVRLSGETAWWLSRQVDAVRQDLTAHPGIEAVSVAAEVPGVRYGMEYLRRADRPEGAEVMTRVVTGADHDYAAVLGLDLVAGRPFSRAAPADSAGFLVNEAAARALGLDAPVGVVLRWDARGYAGPVVGVVEDFHFASLRERVEPLVIPLRPVEGSYLLVRLAGDADAALAHVRERLEAVVPGSPFDAAFLDATLDALYRKEARLTAVFAVFAGLAVLVACLGLFGLAAYTAERRRKEIGVRKVLGASAPRLVAMLSREFAVLVGVAFVVAAPVGYLLMDRWLATFAYRVDPGPWPFLLAGAVALAVALATVGYHALRAALADPVRALRYE